MVIKDDDQIGHEMYAVAIDDATQATNAALKAAGGEAAVVNGKIDEASMKSAGLEPGGILKILDEKCDPLITGEASLDQGGTVVGRREGLSVAAVAALPRFEPIRQTKCHKGGMGPGHS